MDKYVIPIIGIVSYIIFAPFIGGLLEGVDRKISARMQGRKGPSVIQPFYDVAKLFHKQLLVMNKFQTLMVMSYLFFVLLSGALFFGGFDMLMCFFSLSTAVMFLILASTSTHSPFSTIGSHREMMQMMAYEPMVLLTAVGFFQATGSFNVSDITQCDIPAIAFTPGFFIGFVFILTIKFRKSPFDLSTSHHAHQEMVSGLTTDLSGNILGLVTLSHWYENVFLVSVVGLFVVNRHWWSYPLAVVVCAAAYFLEILIDNAFPRVKWQEMLNWTWFLTLAAGGINLLIIMSI